MKILQVHNRYKITGGEWTVVNHEYELLKKEHAVEQLIVDNNEELDSFINKLKLVFSTHYNRSSRESVKKKLLEGNADIMHVHNFFPLLTPSIFDASVEAGIPSVLTLHNYRLLHPNGLLLHNGKIDERSIHGSAYSCIWDGVYRNSILQTAVVAHMIEYHRKRKTWQEKVDGFICLSEFAKSKFIEAGFPEHKMYVKPNFVEDHFGEYEPERRMNENESYYLFVGRISEEKGIRTLLKAWERIHGLIGKSLVIIGHGPIKKELQSMFGGGKSQIVWMGKKNRTEVMNYLKRAKALIFSSEWYEGMPMTILEAFSAGTPVIASDIGSQAEIVTHKKNGLHFKTGQVESLIKAIEWFEKNEELIPYLRKEARREYEQKYSPEVNYSKLMSIYDQLLTSNQ